MIYEKVDLKNKFLSTELIICMNKYARTFLINIKMHEVLRSDNNFNRLYLY